MHDDEDLSSQQPFEASGDNPFEASGDNSEKIPTDDYQTDPYGVLNPEIIDPNTKQLSPVNNEYDDLATEINKKVTEKVLTSTEILDVGAGGQNISSCSGFIECIREGGWSFDWEQYDQMTILIILASVCVLI